MMALALAGGLGAGAAPASAQTRDDSRIGRLSLALSTASAPHDTTLYDAGVSVGYSSPAADVGVSFGGASAPVAGGSRSSFQVAPEAGYHIGWRSRDRALLFHLYGVARLPFQTRSGAGMPNKAGLAASGEVGARVWACSTRDEHLQGFCLGFGLGARYQHHFTDYQIGPAVLPAKSSVLSFPVTVDLGVNADL